MDLIDLNLCKMLDCLVGNLGMDYSVGCIYSVAFLVCCRFVDSYDCSFVPSVAVVEVGIPRTLALKLVEGQHSPLFYNDMDLCKYPTASS